MFRTPDLTALSQGARTFFLWRALPLAALAGALAATESLPVGLAVLAAGLGIGALALREQNRLAREAAQYHLDAERLRDYTDLVTDWHWETDAALKLHYSRAEGHLATALSQRAVQGRRLWESKAWRRRTATGKRPTASSRAGSRCSCIWCCSDRTAPPATSNCWAGRYAPLAAVFAGYPRHRS
jgi:hypothetical protein